MMRSHILRATTSVLLYHELLDLVDQVFPTLILAPESSASSGRSKSVSAIASLNPPSHPDISMRKLVALALVGLPGFCAAEPCVQNFTSSGSFLTGQTYRTTAVLSGVNPQDAFARAYAFTSETGFTVTSANKEAGIIAAAQTVSVGSNRAVPLTISLQPDPAGTRAVISYATLVGQFSPPDAIKKHFCATFAAASDTTRGYGANQSELVAQGRPASSARTPPGLAGISPEQQDAIAKELSKKVGSPQIQTSIDEATPTIARFIGRLSCWMNAVQGINAFNEFAAPGVDFRFSLHQKRPTLSTPYHNAATCLTVVRVHGWTAPANNALQFEVVYKAEDSGESAKSRHEVVRQSDGAWLVTQ
jgi:hypothetical protein